MMEKRCGAGFEAETPRPCRVQGFRMDWVLGFWEFMSGPCRAGTQVSESKIIMTDLREKIKGVL